VVRQPRNSPITRATDIASTHMRPTRRAGALYRASDCDALLRSYGVCGIELPIALFDAASPLVPGNRGAAMGPVAVETGDRYSEKQGTERATGLRAAELLSTLPR